MSERLNLTQIIGLAPNNRECMASSHNFANGESYYGFAVDHICIIYNRNSLYRMVIETPDPTAHVVALAFLRNEFIFCCNSKGILFKYSLQNYEKPVDSMDLGVIPSSIATSEKYLFIVIVY